MTRPKKQKVRFSRPEAKDAARRTPAAAQEGRKGGYFDIQPALLGQNMAGLSALTKSGVRGFPEVDAAQALLARTMKKDRVRGEVLDLSAMGGLLASLPEVKLRAVEGSAAALSALQAAGLEARAAAVGDLLTDTWPDKAKVVALVLSGDRGTAYAMAQVAWAHANTPAGGTLYLAGDRDKGFDRYVRAAGAAFGAGETVARDGGMRVAKLVRRPGPTPPQPPAETFEAFGVQVVGLAGVFSAAKPDKATSLLLSHLDALDLQGKDVLDLGCGTGIIGAWAGRKGAKVTLLDGDLQSVRSARATLEASGLSGAALHSDVDRALPDEQQFDVILSNPPFHVGRGTVLDVALEFIAAAGRRLRAGGTFYLVANDFLPYESHLSALGRVSELAREGGFKVLSVTK